MRLLSKALACCALCLLLGALDGISAQTSGGTKRRAPVNPATQALNRLLASAQEAVDKQDYLSAAQDYQDYIAKMPDDASAHYDLGYVYTALHRPDDAKSEYEKAISLDPKMGPAYLNLGLTLLPADPGAAVEHLQHASDLMPASAQPKYLLGSALERSGKLPQAIEQFQAAAKLDDKDVNTRISLGRALLSAGRPAEAEAAYREALSLQPEDAALTQARLGLAHSLLAQKKLAEGAAELQTYLEIEPKDIPMRIERASVLVDLGKDDDALAELDRAASGGLESLVALKLRSQILWKKKRYDDAVPVLQKAAALAPKDPDFPALLGHIYLEKKLYANSIEELSAAYRIDPTAADVLVDLVAAEYQLKNYTAALGALDALSKRTELPAGSWYIRASCYDNLGQPAPALDAYQEFLQLNKDENSDMYFALTERVRVLTRELKEKKR